MWNDIFTKIKKEEAKKIILKEFFNSAAQKKQLQKPPENLPRIKENLLRSIAN